MSNNLPLDDECFYYHSWRNNSVIAFGTLSSFLTYLHIVNGVVCVVCPFAGDEKWKPSCRCSIITMRSYPPQYPHSFNTLNPSSSLFPPPPVSPPPYFLSFSSSLFPPLFLFVNLLVFSFFLPRDHPSFSFSFPFPSYFSYFFVCEYLCVCVCVYLRMYACDGSNGKG